MRFIIILSCITITLNVFAHSYHNNEETGVFFIEPLTGETVSNPIKITFGAPKVILIGFETVSPVNGSIKNTPVSSLL